jgi:transcriptional regulator with XRE-family HTH domain
MGRFHQRLRKHLENEEFAAEYREMSAKLELIQAIEAAREKLQISKEELATRMNKRREAVSRVLTADDANPTLDTITELLTALGITAEITLRKAVDGETPIKVVTAL